MPTPSSQSEPLLSHAFKFAGSWLPFGRLLLFPDRIERHALGRVQDTILLSDVCDVHWRTTDNDAANFTLTLTDGREVSGRLRGAGLWKTKLQEMLSRPRRAARPTAKAAVKPAA